MFIEYAFFNGFVEFFKVFLKPKNKANCCKMRLIYAS